MTVQNGESVQRGVRVKRAHDNYLIRKAQKNKNNPHNQVATEINILIAADYEASKSKK